MEKTRALVLLLTFAAAAFAGLAPAAAAAPEPDENLPPLLYNNPTQPYEILSPIGAGKKTIPEAKEQLQREAKKVQAEAVVGVRCEPGGVTRQGLTWYNKDSYCRGLAIRYTAPAPPNPIDGSTPPAPRVKTWQRDWD